jgi:hypothetical protein
VDLAEIVVNAKDCFPDGTQDPNGYKDLVKTLVHELKFLPYAGEHLSTRLRELRDRRHSGTSLKMNITPITYPPQSEVEYPETLSTLNESARSAVENSVREGSEGGTVRTQSRSFITSLYKSLASKLSRNTD